MILNDRQIRSLCVNRSDSMIAPFIGYEETGEETRKRDFNNELSYGLSSFGYDIRLGDELKIFSDICSGVCIDPKNFNPDTLVSKKASPGEFFIMPPHSYALGFSVEYFKLPKDVMAIFLGKSTYARAGLVVNVTPAEPGWEGVLTIELANTTPLPLKVYPMEGISQAVFFRGEEAVLDYDKKKGRYQFQTGITLPFVN